MKRLACKRCGYEWDYTGQKRFWCKCPNCLTSVRIYTPKRKRRKNKGNGFQRIAEEGEEMQAGLKKAEIALRIAVEVEKMVSIGKSSFRDESLKEVLEMAKKIKEWLNKNA